MAKARKSDVGTASKRPIEQYAHSDKKRANNPHVGLVTPDSDQDGKKKVYAYDPHLDPSLQWAGKAEHTSFEVPTVSLHVHERIDPKSIIHAVRKWNGAGVLKQPSLFDSLAENPPLREALDFYKHAHNWSNRLIAGDSLLVMNSLLEKEGMAGKVQMVYIDPPYGIKYGSNFQPFVNKRDVKDGKDDDLTQEPEMIRAFRDTWELGIHSYLTYLRDRLLLARDLLHESGSCFVQISDENVHHVKELMDETFGASNCCGIITFVKTSAQEAVLLPSVCDYLVWFSKDKNKVKYRTIWLSKSTTDAGTAEYNRVELKDGTRRRMSTDENDDWSNLPSEARPYRQDNIVSQRPPGDFPVNFGAKTFRPITGYWKTGIEGMQKIITANRVEERGRMLSYVRFFEDFPMRPTANFWNDVRFSSRSESKQYVVQTAARVAERCLLMTTDPGDLVFDPTCGSGTTAFVAEQWGRRWLTCDTSRVATTLAKQRLMTAVFDYYQLKHPQQGVSSGFVYKTVPHIMLKDIANNPDIKPGMSREAIDAAIKRHAGSETLFDQPIPDNKRARVSGPFTVEAVPAPSVRSLVEVTEERLAELDGKPSLPGMEDPQNKNALGLTADVTVARSGETLRHTEWRDELLKSGVRAKGGAKIEFTRVEPLAGCRWLHAESETKDKGQRVVVSFGPEHAPLEQRQVALAWEEAQTLAPKPAILLFAAFQFDPEAAKDIDELTPAKTGMTFLKVQMNTDLLTDDLKKKRASNESFWLMGQPDVEVRALKSGPDNGKLQVEVHGFDYYDPRQGKIISGDTKQIAVWMLDTDYDGRSLLPRQVFFPMSSETDGWARLAKNLKAEIDEELIEAYRGTVSLPFAAGPNRRVAVKIVDDRGIESLKVVGV